MGRTKNRSNDMGNARKERKMSNLSEVLLTAIAVAMCISFIIGAVTSWLFWMYVLQRGNIEE